MIKYMPLGRPHPFTKFYMTESLAAKLRAYRDDRGLSLNQLSALLGYDKSTICRWLIERQKIGKEAREIIKLKLNIY